MTDITTPAVEATSEAVEQPTSEASEVVNEQVASDGTDHEAENGASKKNTAPIQLTVPLDLKAQIEARAKSEGKTAARWALEQAATVLGYTLAPPTRVGREAGTLKVTDVFSKDLTPAERHQRLSDAQALLDALKAGVVNLDEIKAKMAAQEAPAAS